MRKGINHHISLLPNIPSVFLSCCCLLSRPLLWQQQTLSCRHLFVRALRLCLFLFRSHRLIKCSEKNSWLGSLRDFLPVSPSLSHKQNILIKSIFELFSMVELKYFLKEDTDVFVFNEKYNFICGFRSINTRQMIWQHILQLFSFFYDCLKLWGPYKWLTA